MGEINPSDNGHRRSAQLVLVLNVSLASDTQEALLRALAAANGSAASVSPVDGPEIVQVENLWLSLREAAQHIGVSTSTLYKYASQRKIESRKLGGRLQFRRAVLDCFMQEQVRPVYRENRPRSIMGSALSSGK
jgi:excisionase family DNA binding protein